MYTNFKLILLAGLSLTGFIILALWTNRVQLVLKQDYFAHTINGNTLTNRLKSSNLLKLECPKLPDILIIGFEKCGTVTLKKFLAGHPKIFITDSRINNRFFNPENNMSLSEFTKDMPCTPNGKLRLEKVATPAIPKTVQEYIPEVKLIAIVKEPVERALSHFVHLKSNDKLVSNASNFEEFVKDSFESSDFLSPVFHFSFYADRIQPWIDVFGPERILLLDGDGFVTDPVTELQKAEVFLELEPSITTNDFFFSQTKGFYCIKALGEKGCMGRRKGRIHPTMQNATRISLQNFFRPYNQNFSNIFKQHQFKWDYMNT